MLRQRVLTALVLAPLFLFALFFLPPPGFAFLLGLVVLAGAWEWGRLSAITSPVHLLIWLVLVVAVMAASWRWSPAPVVFAVAVAWWALMAFLLIARRRNGLPAWPPAVRLVIGVVVLVPAWYALSWLHEQERVLVLCVLLLVWAADTGAYFTGRALGRHKLAPAISPGKTVEGVLGGLLAATLVAAGFRWLTGPEVPVGGWVALWVISCCASVVGDLAESHLKRLAGAKDSGTLLPGHGGVLDRIDSITAAAPVFAGGWMLLGGEGG